MEELQSTEILEREILEDARKKAHKALKTADDTVNANTVEWEKKTAQAINELKIKYDNQNKLIYEKTMARLPIDKIRAKIEKIENLIDESINDWFTHTSRNKITDLLTKELSVRLNICKGIREVQKKIYYSNLEQKEIEIILKKSDLEITKTEIQEIKIANPLPVITLETNNTRIIVSLQELINNLLNEKREELVSALVGQEFMEESGGREIK